MKGLLCYRADDTADDSAETLGVHDTASNSHTGPVSPAHKPASHTAQGGVSPTTAHAQPSHPPCGEMTGHPKFADGYYTEEKLPDGSPPGNARKVFISKMSAQTNPCPKTDSPRGYDFDMQQLFMYDVARRLWQFKLSLYLDFMDSQADKLKEILTGEGQIIMNTSTTSPTPRWSATAAEVMSEHLQYRVLIAQFFMVAAGAAEHSLYCAEEKASWDNAMTKRNKPDAILVNIDGIARQPDGAQQLARLINSAFVLHGKVTK